MKISTILCLLIILITCSCTEQTSKAEQQNQDTTDQHLKPNTGLKIEYKQTRGIRDRVPYRDSLGAKYSLRYIPTTLTNDSTIPIHVEIAFAKEYDYPIAYDDAQFKVIPMPQEWALDGEDWNLDSLLKELPKQVDRPFLNKTLEPGEECLLAIGTVFPRSATYGVFPMAVFPQNKRAFHEFCDSLVIPDKSMQSHVVLELNLGFTSGSQASPESCTIIPWAQISYPER